jgi:hypothetical protein
MSRIRVFHPESLPARLSAEQVDQLFTVPAVGIQGCWLQALMVFITTGNLYAAAVAFLECLLSSDKLSGRQEILVRGAIALIDRAETASVAGTDEFLPCVFDLLIALLFKGTPLDKALLDFVKCLIGGEAPSDIPPFSPKEVRRCSG